MKAVEKRGVMAVLGRSMVLVLGLLAAAASANQNRTKPQKAAAAGADEKAPESRPMDAAMALGLWKSSFGAVKMELAGQRLQGVWVYDRKGGTEVIGYFEGTLDGNVLEFDWYEPADPSPLKGAGYLVFDPDGRAFTGKWWTYSKDRSDDWNGWRTADTLPNGGGDGGDDGADRDPRGSGGPDDGAPGPAEKAPGPPPDRDYL